jgi:ribosomal protein S18 acetylase RimI-like enzyme
LKNITKAKTQDAKVLSQIAKASFLPAHGHSAFKTDIDNYIADNFSETNFLEELSNPENHYYLIYHDNKLAGYSKITLNTINENIASKNVTYMSRLYLLKEFYGLQLGKELFSFNIEFSKQHNQQGIWLAVWVENQRAINFYTKMGFSIVGSYDFRISATHTNPNHILYLEYKNLQ